MLSYIKPPEAGSEFYTYDLGEAIYVANKFSITKQGYPDVTILTSNTGSSSAFKTARSSASSFMDQYFQAKQVPNPQMAATVTAAASAGQQTGAQVTT